MNAPYAVLASGSGTNLQAILDAAAGGALTHPPAVVLSDRPKAHALVRAQNAGIPTRTVRRRDHADREAFDGAIESHLNEFGAQLVVLAGFMRILSGPLVRRWAGKIINLHPSLLPEFKGKDAIKQALAAGVAVTGCTVHFVDEGVDTGPIIAQEEVPILAGDTVESLALRLHAAEHRLLPQTLARLLAPLAIGPAAEPSVR